MRHRLGAGAGVDEPRVNPVSADTDLAWDLPTTIEQDDAQPPAVRARREPALPAVESQPDLDLTLTPQELDAGLTPAGQQSGSTLFGVAVPGHSAALVAGVVEQIAVNGQNALQIAGVRPHIAAEAARWYRQAARTSPQREPIRHSYRAPVSHLPPELQAQFTSFFNAMHAAGASEAEVAAAVAWYQALASRLQQATPQSPAPSAPAAQARESMSEAQAAALDDADQQRALEELRRRWGSLVYQNLRTVRDYLLRLPRADRERLGSLCDDEGHAWLNSPDALVQLFEEASTKTGPAAGLLAEIQRLEDYMRDNRAAYNRDEPAQARLRELYRQRDG